MNGEFAKVLEIGRDHFVLDDADEHLWSHVVQAAARDGHVGDPLELVPERHRKVESVRIAMVHFLRGQGDECWRDEAARVFGLFPTVRHARQFYADAGLEEAGLDLELITTGCCSRADDEAS